MSAEEASSSGRRLIGCRGVVLLGEPDGSPDSVGQGVVGRATGELFIEPVEVAVVRAALGAAVDHAAGPDVPAELDVGGEAGQVVGIPGDPKQESVGPFEAGELT